MTRRNGLNESKASETLLQLERCGKICRLCKINGFGYTTRALVCVYQAKMIYMHALQIQFHFFFVRFLLCTGFVVDSKRGHLNMVEAQDNGQPATDNGKKSLSRFTICEAVYLLNNSIRASIIHNFDCLPFDFTTSFDTMHALPLLFSAFLSFYARWTELFESHSHICEKLCIVVSVGWVHSPFIWYRLSMQRQREYSDYAPRIVQLNQALPY